MGNPQFDRLKTAPLQALRAMFAGIGRILLSADRPQNQARRAYERASGDNGQSRPQPTTSTPEASSRWRSLDTTGNVRLLPPRTRDENGPGTSERTAAPAPQPEPGDEPTPEPAAEAEPAEEPVAEAAPASAAEPITEPIPAVPVPAAEAASPELPLASYDTLSLPSIRARLRNLDVDQLRTLIEYERAHAERPEVLRMFERRIEKLETGG